MPFFQILRSISIRFFFYVTIVCHICVLSGVSWLVSPLKLRVAIQLTLSLGLILKIHCEIGWPVSAGVSVAGTVVHFV